MIRVEGLDSKKYILNGELIEKIEEVPETVITLLNGKKYLIKESSEEVVEKVINFKRKINNLNT